MESSLSIIIFEGRTVRFQGCSPSWFEAHWQLSIKILHLNFHFPNAQLSLLRVYLECGAKLPTNNFGHMEIANPREPTKFHDSIPHSEDEWFETLKKTFLVNPNPPKKNTVYPRGFPSCWWICVSPPFCLVNSFGFTSKPTIQDTWRFFNLSKGHRLDQNRSNQLGLLDLPKYSQDGDLYLK